MAAQDTQIEMVEVKSEDIMEDRRSMYDGFMNASVWAIGGTVLLLVALYLFFG